MRTELIQLLEPAIELLGFELADLEVNTGRNGGLVRIFIDKEKTSDAYLTFYNSDGGKISTCGNGSRCAAFLLMKENNNKKKPAC